MSVMTEDVTAQSTSSAQGEDRSSYQRVGPWPLSFGITKATERTDWADSTFAANWYSLKSEGKVRGAYHFLHPSFSPLDQARFFVRTVRNHGLEPGDILAADVEITVGTDGNLIFSENYSQRSNVVFTQLAGQSLSAELVAHTTRMFLDEVRSLVGPHHPIMVYTTLSIGATLGSCTSYPLWIAHPGGAPASVAPWGRWRIWQWEFGGGPGGGDRDAFNGDHDALLKWIDSYKPSSPTPDPEPPPVIHDAQQLNNGAGAETIITFPVGTAHYVEFASDASGQGLPAPIVRVAVHSQSKGYTQIEAMVQLPDTGKKKVEFTEHDVDMVAVHRMATGSNVTVGYDFA